MAPPPLDLPRAPWLAARAPRARSWPRSTTLERAATPHATFTLSCARGRFGRKRPTRVFLNSVSWVDGDGEPQPLRSHQASVLDGADSDTAADQRDTASTTRDRGDTRDTDDDVEDGDGVGPADDGVKDGRAAAQECDDDDDGSEILRELLAAPPVPPLSSTELPSAPTPPEPKATPPPTFTLTRGELVTATLVLGRRYWMVEAGRRRWANKVAAEKKRYGEAQATSVDRVACLSAHVEDVRAALGPLLDGVRVLRAWEVAAEAALAGAADGGAVRGKAASAKPKQSKADRRAAAWNKPAMPPTTDSAHDAATAGDSVPIALPSTVCFPRLSPTIKAAFAHALALRDTPDFPPVHEQPWILKDKYDGTRGYAWFPPDPSKAPLQDD